MPFVVPQADVYLQEILQLLVDQGALNVSIAQTNWPQFAPYPNNLRERLGKAKYDGTARVIANLVTSRLVIPDVVGLAEGNAISELAASGFSNYTILAGTCTNYPVGHVCVQDPIPFTYASPDTNVRLYVL